MAKTTPAFGEWRSYWRTDEEGHSDGGVFYEDMPGHAYAVCKTPRYVKREEWEKTGALIAAAPELAEELRGCIAAFKAIHDSATAPGVGLTADVAAQIREAWARSLKALEKSEGR